MFEATPKATPKKKAHENMLEAIRGLKFPGRLSDMEREAAMGDIVVHCRARANDIIPEEIVESLCHDLLVAAVNSDAQMAPSIWQFVVSQMEDEQLAIVMLDEIALSLDEGWVVWRDTDGEVRVGVAEKFDEQVGPLYAIVEMMQGVMQSHPLARIFGLPPIPGELRDPIIARVGPQPEVPSACGCVCAECEARAAGCPILEAIAEAGGCGREFAGAGIPDDEEIPAEQDSNQVIQGIRDRCRQCADTTDAAPEEQDSGQPEIPEVEEPPAASD